MNIVRPTLADFHDIRQQCCEFAAFLDYKHDYLPDEMTMAALFANWAKNHVFLAAKDESGDILGIICGEYIRHHWNPEKTLLIEHFWWTKPSARSRGVGRRLLEEYIARSAPVSAMRFHFESKTPIESKILEQHGFRHAETVFIKEF